LVALFELDAAVIHFVDKQNRLIPLTFQGVARDYWRKLRETPLALGDTTAGRCAQQKKSLIIQDTESFEEELQLEISVSGMRTMADIPLLVSDRLIGVLSLGARRPNALAADDLLLLESLGAQLAFAIEATRLHEQTERRIRNLTTLTRVSAALNKTLNLDKVLRIVLDEVLALVNPSPEQRKGVIFLVEPNEDRLRFGVAHGLPSDALSQAESFDSLSPQAAESWITLPGLNLQQIIASPTLVELPAQPQADPSGLFAGDPLIAISLRVEEHPIGVVLITGQIASSEMGRLLMALIDMAAVSIQKAHLHQETRRRLGEVSLLHQVALASASALDFDIIAFRVVQAIQQTLGFEHIHVLLMDDNNEFLSPPSSSDDIRPGAPQQKLRVGEGLCGQAAQTGKLILVQDLSLVENPGMLVPHAQSGLCVPLKVGERIIGVIEVESAEPNAFSADDERLMTTIAGQLAVAFENARLHQETQRRLREMTTLFNFAHQLSTHLHMEGLLQSIVTSIREVLGCRGVSIALVDEDSQMLEIKTAAGLTEEWRKKARLRVGDGIMGQVAATGKSVYVSDVSEVEDFIFFDQAFQSLLTVPLIFKSQVIGTLSVDHEEPDAFTADDERLVTIAAAQAAVAIENARLFLALQERATSLAQAYEELREIDRLKDELVQTVSHELRTPLTFVRGYVDLLLSGHMGPLNERQKQSLEIASQKTATVANLVNNIMLLQQLDYSPLQLALTDIKRVANEAFAKAEVAAQRQGVSIVLNSPPELPLILADPERVALVFQHLLDNAIKFSPNGGTVQLRLMEEPDCIHVAVSDQGIGIAKDQLARVFERFYQVDASATRLYEGIGLGLNIAKRIVQAHGGEMWVKSKIGKGSIFYFTLPKSRQGRSADTADQEERIITRR
jgi:signal transduction histidine kinase